MGIEFQATAQAFFPDDHRVYPLYDLCRSLGKAVQFHSGTTGFGAGTPGGMGLKLKYCRPIPHIDDVAVDFPDLTIIACHPSRRSTSATPSGFSTSAPDGAPATA